MRNINNKYTGTAKTTEQESLSLTIAVQKRQTRNVSSCSAPSCANSNIPFPPA